MVKHRNKSALLRAERIQRSPRFNGRVFLNTHPVSQGLKPGVERPSMRDFLCGGRRRVPSGPLPLVDPVETWRSPPASGLRVTWLGHSTLFIEIDGVRVLTDPVWGDRASPLPFAGPRRFHPPPVALDALPTPDVVVLSHDHYDHLDRGTIRALAAYPVPFVASLGVGAHLETWGIPPARITELDWWETTQVAGVTLTAAPAQHFSGRGIRSRNTTLWSSWQLRGDRHAFFYGADSGLTPEFADIGTALGPFDVVALEIGAYHPAWGDIHMGPENAMRAAAMLGSGVFLPIHWGTFNLAMHPWDEPIETVLHLAPASGVRVMTPRLGQPVENIEGVAPDPWWRVVAAGGETAGRRDQPPAMAGSVDWLPD